MSFQQKVKRKRTARKPGLFVFWLKNAVFECVLIATVLILILLTLDQFNIVRMQVDQPGTHYLHWLLAGIMQGFQVGIMIALIFTPLLKFSHHNGVAALEDAENYRDFAGCVFRVPVLIVIVLSLGLFIFFFMTLYPQDQDFADSVLIIVGHLMTLRLILWRIKRVNQRFVNYYFGQ